MTRSVTRHESRDDQGRPHPEEAPRPGVAAPQGHQGRRDEREGQ
ncbi:MAG TPA: hypothetical protein VLL48_07240 [Longimicrobiales bacterium]|nr:hypothetical protein [Longimicrobiales bacterium]